VTASIGATYEQYNDIPASRSWGPCRFCHKNGPGFLFFFRILEDGRYLSFVVLHRECATLLWMEGLL